MRYLWILVVVLTTLVTTAQEPDDCADPRLQVGDFGYVITQDPINVRETPNGDRVGQLQQWEAFRVIDGSACEVGFHWWQIATDDLTGWVAEGSGEDYWLDPVTLTDDSVIDTTTFNLLMLLEKFTGEGNSSTSLAISDAWYVLSAGYPDDKVYAWHRIDTDQNIVISPELGENGYISDTAIYRNVVAVYIGDDETIAYWDLSTGEQLGTIEDFVYDMDFAEDILIYIGLKTIHGYRFLEEILTIDTSPKTGTQLAITPDKTQFAVIYLDRTMDLFNINGDTIETFDASGSGIFDVTFSADSQQMIYAYCREPIEAAGQECIHHKIIFWDITEQEPINTIDFLNFDGGTSHIELAINPAGDLLVIHPGADLWGFDIETGEVIGHIADFIGEGIQFSADGKTLIQRGSWSELQLWGLPQIE